MPFTLAHPAVLFPIMKQQKYFSATALIVGSMVPDVEFIAQLQESSTYSHHFPGIFLINIPLGLLLCWFFHQFIKEGLIKNLPTWLLTRLHFIIALEWNKYFKANKVIVITSLCMGIASHLAWDAFTHDNGFFVNIWPSLNQTISFLNREMPIYHSLQIISSVLGLAATVYVLWRLPQTILKTKKTSLQYWLSFGAIFALLSLMRFVIVDFNNGFWDVVLGLMGISLYAVVINSLFHFFWLHKPMKPEP